MQLSYLCAHCKGSAGFAKRLQSARPLGQGVLNPWLLPILPYHTIPCYFQRLFKPQQPSPESPPTPGSPQKCSPKSSPILLPFLKPQKLQKCCPPAAPGLPKSAKIDQKSEKVSQNTAKSASNCEIRLRTDFWANFLNFFYKKQCKKQTEFRGKLERKTLKKQRLNKVRMCRKPSKNHSPRHILQKPLATRKTKPNRKIRKKGLEKPCQKNKKKESIPEQILTQKSWIFGSFRPPGPPEVLKMLLRVPFRKTLQI